MKYFWGKFGFLFSLKRIFFTTQHESSNFAKIIIWMIPINFFNSQNFRLCFFFLFSSSSNYFYNISQFQSHFIRNLFLWDKISKFLWWNITSHPNWAWWGLRVRDFRFRFGMRSTPKLLFRFLFFLSLGRSIGFPCASTGYGERAWCKISQHRFLSRPLGLQTKTMIG